MCRCIEPHVPWDMVHFPIGPPAIIGVNTAIMEVSQWGDPQIIHVRLGCSIINDPAIDPPFMDANLYILGPLGESLSRRWDESHPIPSASCLHARAAPEVEQSAACAMECTGLGCSSWRNRCQHVIHRISECFDLEFGLYSHRIHGAGIYANMTGVYWWDPCYIMLPYIAAPWIRHGIWMNLGKSPFPSPSAKANRHKSELMDLFWLLWLSGRSTVDDDVAATWISIGGEGPGGRNDLIVSIWSKMESQLELLV